jgi:ABC-2 type transport system ATP-binding protein
VTVAEIIEFTRPFFRRWRHDLERRYLDLFELPTRGKIPNLSRGMRSKLMLLLAFCRGADLLVLDEPTDGLDPTAIEIVLRELIALAGSGGTTIFFSSHQLAEVEQVADEIAIIERGRAIVCGGLEDLKQEYRQISVIFAQEVHSDLYWTEGAERVRQEGRMVSVLTRHKVEEIMARAAVAWRYSRAATGTAERDLSRIHEGDLTCCGRKPGRRRGFVCCFWSWQRWQSVWWRRLAKGRRRRHPQTELMR